MSLLNLGSSKNGNPIRSKWDRLHRLPGGKALFSKLIGKFAPYSGTIDAKIVDLGPGFAKVEMRDQKKVRNHLNSIHAIALMNLGEIATGLATLYALPDDAKAIIVKLSIEYKKKARGLLTALCDGQPIMTNERKAYEFIADIKDESGDVVASVTANWLIGPK